MGKKNVHKVVKNDSKKTASLASVLADKAALDPSLASLFASSSGPVKAPSKSVSAARAPIATSEEKESKTELESEDDAPDGSPVDLGSSLENENGSAHGSEDLDAIEPVIKSNVNENESRSVFDLGEHSEVNKSLSRKRKRYNTDEDLEDAYLRKLARQEEKEAAQKRAERKQKLTQVSALENPPDSNGPAIQQGSDDSDAEEFEIPQHETLEPSRDEGELEKASRTVFLGNVSTQAITSKSAKKTLLQHLVSFVASLPPHTPPHRIESLRFRSTPFASAIPKKAAFARKELMDATTKSTNAYVVYSTQLAAKEAAKSLNGTVILDRHLRVDSVAHPAKIDHRRCVFVGNLGFVDDESLIREAEAAEGKKTKAKPPGDVEEGLWLEFSKAGPIESVRVVRDAKTRVGKGFAYVQFKDENGVEAALHFDGKKFPPLLPRALRVTRAKAIKRKDAKKAAPNASSKGMYNPKLSSRDQSNLGRASKLLGRAGAAYVRAGTGAANGMRSKITKPEAFVFEGHRASAKQGKLGFKFNRSSKKKAGKPQDRSRKRAAAWKAAGGGKKK